MMHKCFITSFSKKDLMGCEDLLAGTDQRVFNTIKKIRNVDDEPLFLLGFGDVSDEKFSLGLDLSTNTFFELPPEDLQKGEDGKEVAERLASSTEIESEGNVDKLNFLSKKKLAHAN